jgi:hypothetical protein
MVPTIAVHPLRASDHRQPEKATAEAVLLLDGMRCCGVKCRCSTQATITAHRTKLRRLRQAIRSDADRCDVLLTRVQAARLSLATRPLAVRRDRCARRQPSTPGPRGTWADVSDEADDRHLLLASQDDAEKKRAAQWPPSRHAVSAIAVYAAALIAVVGSPSRVSRSDCSTTVAISRRRSNLSHRA